MNVMKNLMTMYALASAVCLVSCSSDDEMNVNNDGQVRFTAAIGNEAVVATPGTRASGTTWGPNDDIGISVSYTHLRAHETRHDHKVYRRQRQMCIRDRSTSPRYTPTDSSAPRPVKKTFHPS